MKRTWVALGLLCMACSTLMAQKPLTENLGIAGNIKSDYVWRENSFFEEGTPCTLQFVTKLKNPSNNEDKYQVVLF